MAHFHPPPPAPLPRFFPTSTRSEGGFFKAELKFPDDFPNTPPKMTFLTPMWHPNSACPRRGRPRGG